MKYLDFLERELEFLKKQLAEQRADLEFYRGKCERLELAMASTSPLPAVHEYAVRSENHAGGAPLRRMPEHAQRVPFSDLRRKWNELSAEDQEKAMKDGWTVEQEDAHAGRS